MWTYNVYPCDRLLGREDPIYTQKALTPLGARRGAIIGAHYLARNLVIGSVKRTHLISSVVFVSNRKLAFFTPCDHQRLIYSYLSATWIKATES